MNRRRSRTDKTKQLKIMQEQVGHSYASTTALYTSVSSDFRVRTLRRVLDGAIGHALHGTQPPPGPAAPAREGS